MMQVMRHTIVCGIALWSAFFLSPTAVKGQTGVSYRFLEVIDTAGKPVADATVETFEWASRRLSTQQTDQKGITEKLRVLYGDSNTKSLKVSKRGFLTYEDEVVNSHASINILLEGEIPHYDPQGPMKIELLKIPSTSAARKAVEVEQRQRDLILAAKREDVATVRRLLKAGVNANATDSHGIPAILWAVSSYGAETNLAETIQALLAAGADVRSRDKPGRKALLYYLYLNGRGQINEEIVRSLIKAGADVNAAHQDGTTVLMLAEREGDAHLIKLLESGGAQR